MENVEEWRTIPARPQVWLPYRTLRRALPALLLPLAVPLAEVKEPGKRAQEQTGGCEEP